MCSITHLFTYLLTVQSHTGFRLMSKSVTLNDLERRNDFLVLLAVDQQMFFYFTDGC